MVKYICLRLLIFISGQYYHTNFYDIIGIENKSKEAKNKIESL